MILDLVSNKTTIVPNSVVSVVLACKSQTLSEPKSQTTLNILIGQISDYIELYSVYDVTPEVFSG